MPRALLLVFAAAAIAPWATACGGKSTPPKPPRPVPDRPPTPGVAFVADVLLEPQPSVDEFCAAATANELTQDESPSYAFELRHRFDEQGRIVLESVGAWPPSLDAAHYTGCTRCTSADAGDDVTSAKASRMSHPPEMTLRQFLGALRDVDGYLPALLIGIDGTPSAAAGPTQESTLVVPGQGEDWARRFSEDYADQPCVRLDSTKKRGVRVELSVGRSRSCDVFMSDPSVSKQHATLTIDRASGEFIVVDLGSRNGTYLDGKQLAPDAPVAIWPGVRIAFGSALFLFVDPGTLRQLASLVR